MVITRKRRRQRPQHARSKAKHRFAARFQKAMVYAARLHAGQMKKGTDRPYIGHLLGVTALVIQYGGDEDQAIAALLHDAAEDQGGLKTLREIRRRFGRRVAHIVDGCTDTYESPKPPWLERKKRYVARVRREPAEVRLVSAADKLSNVREILADYREWKDAVWQRFKGGKDGTLWYYRAMVQALREARAAGQRAGRLTALVDELDRALTELEGLAT